MVKMPPSTSLVPTLGATCEPPFLLLREVGNRHHMQLSNYHSLSCVQYFLLLVDQVCIL